VEHKGLLRGAGWLARNHLHSLELAACTIRRRLCTFVHNPGDWPFTRQSPAGLQKISLDFFAEIQ
jgi:hypothetical protein